MNPGAGARQCREYLRCAKGSTLAEFVISAGVTSLVSGIIVSAMLRLGDTEKAIGNRTEMHAGARGATELIQHELSQAGRITLPAAATLASAIAAPGPQTVAVSSALGMFVGEQLVIDAGNSQETVSLTAVDTAANTISATFGATHATNVPVTVWGAFASGIVPTATTNGSSADVLKIYGDINGTGNLVYVEYLCDTAGGKLYRNMVALTATSKPALTGGQILLDRILPNPGGAPCFSYQQKTVGSDTFVIAVAITLTVATEFVDPITNQRQSETVALMHASPRNIFEAWELTSLGLTNRIQPMPASVVGLLP